MTSTLAGPSRRVPAAGHRRLRHLSRGLGRERPAAVGASGRGAFAPMMSRRRNEMLRTVRLVRKGMEGVLRGRPPSSSASASQPTLERDDPSPSSVTLTAVVGSGRSHFGFPKVLDRPNATWKEVALHLRDLLRWTDARYGLEVLDASSLAEGGTSARLATSQLIIVLGAPASARALVNLQAPPGCSVVGFSDDDGDGEGEALEAFDLKLSAGESGGLLGDLFGGRARAEAALAESVRELWARRNADDLLFLALVLIDACVEPVPRVSMTSKGGGGGNGGGLGLIWCMLTNCREEVVACVTDPECKAALDCLTGCGLNDQVCSYQCIVSHESPLFERFSQCVLQRHNCMRNAAEVPTQPVVEPISHFRGEPLTHEVAEDILIGWLGQERHSWKVVTGQNAAYDIFPNQHQIFYRGKRKRSFWYDPVFQARKFDGELVWRRRHYRVRRGPVPGTFFFSVLDNGVISNEFWRIADAAEDLSWTVLYYAGAASTAGQAYTGAVFATRDGQWPDRAEFARVEAAHAKCGIKLWELFEVENYPCPDAPLDLLE